MNNRTVLTNSADETRALGASLVKALKQTNIIALHGELGSGKTTFVQGLAKELGIKKRITSPTFIIVRKYEVRSMNYEGGFENLYHIDLYRLEDDAQMNNLGLSEIIEDSGNLVVIEWAEKMGELLSKHRIDVRFEYLDEGKRKISITDC